MMEFALEERYVKETWKVLEVEEVQYAVLEVAPSRLTSNAQVKWLITEFARLHKPISQRLNFTTGKMVFTPQLSIWWEVYIH